MTPGARPARPVGQVTRGTTAANRLRRVDRWLAGPCARVLRRADSPLVVDLEQVSFIDSVGLATLVGAAKRAEAHGGSLQVACALPKIRQLVHLTGLDCRIPLARTLDEALEFRAATSTNPPC